MGKPYYEADGITLYHGDCREILSALSKDVLQESAMITDPPYGIAYRSGSPRRAGAARGCVGDQDVSLRDEILNAWDRRALVFGSWKVPKPTETRMTIYWDTGGALGMGDLSLPWKNSSQEIYALGRGFVGRRQGNVLRYPPVQAIGREHPFEKPIDLMQALVQYCPDSVIFDPFSGSGSTLVAAKQLGRRAIGCEVEERYCELIAVRLSQGVLALGGNRPVLQVERANG